MPLEQKKPGPDHPIRIEPNANRVVVTYQDATLADSRNAKTMREANYPPVHYIPRSDVNMSLLERTDEHTHCPYKGEASYYALRTAPGEAIAWSYEAPYSTAAELKDHIAFYPEKVDKIEERMG